MGYASDDSGEDELRTVIAEAAAGTGSAFEKLIAFLQIILMRLLTSMVRNVHDAEDIFQDACFAIYKTLPEFEFRTIGEFIGWATVIAKRLVYRFSERRRKRHALTIHDPNSPIDAASTTTSPEARSNMRDLIGFALGKLTEEQREALTLIYLEGLTYEEAERRLRIPWETVASRARAGLMKLRKLLPPELRE